MVGFGGGSSYLALLALSGISFQTTPIISLICNLLVVSGGTWHYYRQGHFNKKLILPFVLSSVPMAFIGGMYPLSERTFLILLASSLFLAGIRLFFTTSNSSSSTYPPSFFIAILVGAVLGLLSGLVGLGGGIFLSPLLLNFKWATPKEAAATASFFIMLNSISGLLGQLTKRIPVELGSFSLLFMLVIFGGQIGSRIGSHPKISQKYVQMGTAILVLFIAVRFVTSI
jgi:hypothetical protein